MSRQSELQRKLESLPAPKPPANLADRIKNEIPHDLRFNVEEEREHLSSGIALNLRVAASILVLISTAYLAIHVLTRTSNDTQSMVSVQKRQAAQPAVATAADTAAQTVAVAGTAAPQAAPAETDRLESKQASKVAGLYKKERAARQEEKKDAPADELLRVDEVARPASPEPAIADAGQVAEAITITASAPASNVAPPPPPAAVTESIVQAAPQAAPAVEQTRSAKAAASSHDVAGFRDAKKNESVIQRFAAPDVLPGAPVLDVEAAEESFSPGTIVVRASFDSGVPVKDLWVDTMLSKEAGPKARWLAGSWRWGSADWKSTRTVLVEFPLPASGDASLATIRARYRVGDDPITQTVERVVRRSDVRAWSVASPRTKKSTLAALWQMGTRPRDVIDAARAAGLPDLARAVEQQQP